MKEHNKTKVRRRDVLRAIGLGAGAAATGAVPLATQAAATESDSEKKKARYQANSADVKNYYRVNRYPS